MDERERINADVWRSGEVLEIFANRTGFIDRGETQMLARIAHEAKGMPILDIGVGAGRTIPFLQPAAEGYVAVDYLEEVVSLARSRHPGVRIEQADARDLSAFDDDTFAAALFSFNGIDGIPHQDRYAVHLAVRRVLRPGGVFAYSTHNLEHCCAGRPPWDRSWWDLDNGPRAMLAFAARLPRRSRSYLRLREMVVRRADWALLVGSAYDFSVLWHHVTPTEAAAELRRAGYQPDVEVYDTAARRLGPGADTGGSPWLYLLGRKPAA
ncbi:MAG: class I SAM-dependent methyltransferase [Solirubrobacteraceae bacterium]